MQLQLQDTAHSHPTVAARAPRGRSGVLGVQRERGSQEKGGGQAGGKKKRKRSCKKDEELEHSREQELE